MAKKKTTPGKKKTTAKAAAPKKISPSSKMRTKSDFYNVVAEQTELSRKQVASVFDAVGRVLAADLSKSGAGKCNIPGLMRVVVQRKPATKSRQAPNPFKPGEMMTVKAKPARNVVRVRPLKGLKEMV